jgi:hypothetical protein
MRPLYGLMKRVAMPHLTHLSQKMAIRKVGMTRQKDRVGKRTCRKTLGGGGQDGQHSRWLAGFGRRGFPYIGQKPIDLVDNACLVEVLSPNDPAVAD